MSTQEIALSPAPEISLPLTARLHDLALTVDHKKLGLMYIVTALIFLVIAGLMAFTIRMQLLVPNNTLVPPDVFNRLFTMHGTTMVFFVGMPLIAGLMNYLVPLMIGARDMAFPRLNAFGYWMTLFGGMLLYFSYLAMPPLSAAQIMLLLDRFLGAHFFDTQAGGSAVLWQHFFWLFGHPEVYILIIPAFACASEIIPVFSRKPIFGYPAMVAATLLIGFISVGVWAHHMFSVGMTAVGNTFFVVSTLLIAVPTGIKIFNWLGTLYGGQIRFELPMLFSLGFLFQFLIAGLTGVMLGVAPFDWHLTDSYFVLAHFHYTLVGSFIFMMFGA